MLTGGHSSSFKIQTTRWKSGVCYLSAIKVEGTKGPFLKWSDDDQFHHKPVNVEAEIFSIDSMSAHADSDDLVRVGSKNFQQT